MENKPANERDFFLDKTMMNEMAYIYLYPKWLFGMSSFFWEELG